MPCPFHSGPPHLWSFPLSPSLSLSPCLFLFHPSRSASRQRRIGSFAVHTRLLILISCSKKVQLYARVRHTTWAICCMHCTCLPKLMKSIDPFSLKGYEEPSAQKVFLVHPTTKEVNIFPVTGASRFGFMFSAVILTPTTLQSPPIPCSCLYFNPSV